MTRLYPFHLAFNESALGKPSWAFFPFIIDEVPLAGISCVLSSRSSGNMKFSPHGEPNPNQIALFNALGLDAGKVRGLRQVHSREVFAVEKDMELPSEGDGLVSRDTDTVLSVTIADCLPIFLYDPRSGAFGLLHSGWKGTGIVRNALRLMAERWQTRPEDMAAVLGPCIRSCCYQVDEGRARTFEAEFGAEAVPDLGRVVERREGTFFLNLQAANVRLLAKAGVRNISFCENCTFTDERLGSFRREKENYTLMAALLGFFDSKAGVHTQEPAYAGKPWSG